jgi:hypothetical protein
MFLAADTTSTVLWFFPRGAGGVGSASSGRAMGVSDRFEFRSLSWLILRLERVGGFDTPFPMVVP